MSAIQFDPMLFGEDAQTGLPLIVMAADLSGSSAMLLVADSEGRLRWRDVDGVITGWRWSEARGWHDVGAMEDESRDG